MGIAPVVLFVYNRPEHTAATLGALRANPGAADTQLFIFSDGPRHDADRPAVRRVRDLVRAKAGFRSVELLERAANQGLAKSIVDGVSRVLADHDRVIVLEDDIVTSPHFLRFMNAALERYGDISRIFTVTGYNLPPGIMRIPRRYTHDVYLSPRVCSWGWGTWRSRWSRADWQLTNYDVVLRDPGVHHALRLAGADVAGMLEAARAGRLESWAIHWAFTHLVRGAMTLYPVRSYVDNVGLDGSGAHCGPNAALGNDLDRALPEAILPCNLGLDEEVVRAASRYYWLRTGLGRVRRFILDRLSRRRDTLV